MECVATTADRMKQIMNEMDLRQIDISKQTGIRQWTISHYIADRLSTKADAVEKMANTLGVSELWLMGYNVPMTVEVGPEAVRNQAITDIALRMQTDGRYMDVVIRMYKLDREKLDAVAAIVESMQ